jgi:multicomponent Na+:H+ antiporter subunit F
VSTVYAVVCGVEFALMAALLWRVWRGPSVTDRIVALNTMSTQAALATIFYAALANRTIYLDPAIWLSSFSYLGAMVWARYLERGLL